MVGDAEACVAAERAKEAPLASNVPLGVSTSSSAPPAALPPIWASWAEMRSSERAGT
jgi:hypothetical protein